MWVLRKKWNHFVFMWHFFLVLPLCFCSSSLLPMLWTGLSATNFGPAIISSKALFRSPVVAHVLKLHSWVENDQWLQCDSVDFFSYSVWQQTHYPLYPEDPLAFLLIYICILHTSNIYLFILFICWTFKKPLGSLWRHHRFISSLPGSPYRLYYVYLVLVIFPIWAQVYY